MCKRALKLRYKISSCLHHLPLPARALCFTLSRSPVRLVRYCLHNYLTNSLNSLDKTDREYSIIIIIIIIKHVLIIIIVIIIIHTYIHYTKNLGLLLLLNM